VGPTAVLEGGPARIDSDRHQISAEAQPPYARAVHIWRITLGNDHPKVLQGIFEQANLLHRLQRFDEALPLCPSRRMRMEWADRLRRVIGQRPMSALLSVLLRNQPCDQADGFFEMFPHRGTSALRIAIVYRAMNRFVPFQDRGWHIRDK
jgi:hypothetical protein